MAASRLFLLGTTFLKSHKFASSFPLTHQLPKSFPHQTLSFKHRFYCSATSIDAIDTTSIDAVESRHPWPEWVAFVDRLKSKGYLMGSGNDDDDSEGESGEIDGVYMDINVLKGPCCSFARDRFDLLKSLSKKDIETVVEAGCPNVLRKAVNSGKRLRAYLKLDEGEVCSGCNLRGSCDRAYKILKMSDADSAARTVDIMRILLFYALDPLVLSGGEKPSGRARIEISSRKLLSELIELSESCRAPALPKPVAKATQNMEMERGDWMCSKCNFLNFARNSQCRQCKENGLKKVGDRASVGADDVDMKKGDWICNECNFLNFARNTQCRQCKEDGPKKVGPRAGVGKDVIMAKGDWICTECRYINFARRRSCKECNSNGPDRISSKETEMKAGDWFCPQCAFMNFSKNKNCVHCSEARPRRELNPGEWECPSCDYLNFRRNKVCLECNCDRPKDTVQQQHEDHEWASMKAGDWNCPECSFMNFSNNKNCLRCREARPKRQLNPGEWECPSCDYLNFRRNEACLKCKCDRPKDAVQHQHEDHEWIR